MAGWLAISYLAAYLNGWLVGYLAGYLNGRYLDGWLAIKKIKNKNNKELGNKNSYYFFCFIGLYRFFFFRGCFSNTPLLETAGRL